MTDLLRIRNARIVDPEHERHGQEITLVAQDGRLLTDSESTKLSKCVDEIDAAGLIVMAGGIDIHTHIAGGKVNLARCLAESLPDSTPIWPCHRNGRLYNAMGYTTCFEPAMLLSGARHTHLELADTPNLDTGAYVVLGNEDWLLKLIGEDVDDETLKSLVGWSMHASRALAVKVVNPGGISAFKFNQRNLDVDIPHSHFGVTPRSVIRRLAQAVDSLGVPHPLHVHASNLGIAGNIRSTLATLNAAEGCRLHLTHAQFHCYSDDGPYGMGSAAECLAHYVNEHTNISLDVGQVVFGQTITLSADSAAQYRNHRFAKPNNWIVNEIECQAGCGLVPMRYENRQYVHSLQWAIGLELMLLISDPWRVFLTTDHPNGGPFTSYPHLIRLLMDRSFRLQMLEQIHPDVGQRTLLREIQREYSLDEIAIITRAAPARILGIDRHCGSLRSGRLADVVAYRKHENWEQTFREVVFLIKRGRKIFDQSAGHAWDHIELPRLHTDCYAFRYDCDLETVNKFADMIQGTLRVSLDSLTLSDEEMLQHVGQCPVYVGH
ncbi:MAG: formylmethanofuran dehydrogenase subunit A [Planctomycetales bacterium]|nr:formylmethanofuran dehydrogenase subunit A [Planctomycetales bacterium]